MRRFGQDDEGLPEEQTEEQVSIESPDGGTEVYNVSEQAVLYDTIAITEDLPNLAKQPPGWFETYALFGGAVDHSFFNVRNRGNCEAAYCNLDTRDQTAFAFRATGIGLSWWAQTIGPETEAVAGTTQVDRKHLPSAIWQLDLPIHASLILKLQQDEKTKANAAMLVPGYGISGGGWQNFAGGVASGAVPETNHFSAANQGIPAPSAVYRFPNIIDIPRRANLSAVLSFSEYARQLLQAMPGPGTFVSGLLLEAPVRAPVMVGVTAVIYGRRLVQQRGALRA